MRLTTLLLMAGAGLAVAAGQDRPGPAKDDAARLQGAWAIVSVEYEGQKLATDKLKAGRLDVKGTRYSFTLDKTDLEFTFALHPGKTPRAIDLTVAEGPNKGKVYHGIYVFEDGRYKICRPAEPGKDRPTAFATTPKSGLLMVVWKRADGSGKN
jgi:uncharacterized protein (TIGR03067 family)